MNYYQNENQRQMETGRNSDGTVYSPPRTYQSPFKSELERLQWMLNHGDCDEAYNDYLRERIAKLS